MPLVLPSEEIIEATNAPVTQITRRIEVTESDGSTVWRSSDSLGLLGGSVSVDANRDERRSFDIELENIDGSLTPGPDGLWYDKIIKVYRGVRSGSTIWERHIGEFFIDSISKKHHPRTVGVSGRDRTKVLLKSKFARATTFPKNHPIEEVVRTIAVNGGVPTNRINLPLTGVSTGREFPFDAKTERWKAIKEVCTSHNYDVYFDNAGMLRMSLFADPATGIPEFTFQTGPEGNLASFRKSVSDSRLYNHIVVTGEAGNQVPIVATASNTAASSPTRIALIGQRSYFYTSSFITSKTQAQDVANRFLKIYAMESFDLSMESIVIPWMEPGIVVEFLDPDPGPNDPTNFLLTDFTIPLNLNSMKATGKRITVVS